MSEVRKLGANDLQIGEGTVQSPGGKTVTEFNASHVPLAYGTANDDVTGMSSVVFSVDDALSSWVDVRAYKAAVDGTTDDSTAFSNALATGKSVYIPEGTMLVTKGFTISSNGQMIFGNGPNSIIKVSGADFDLFTPSGNITYFMLDNLMLYGGATGATTTQYVVFTDASNTISRGIFKRLVISGPDSSTAFNNGFKFNTGSDENEVSYCTFDHFPITNDADGCGYAILTGDSLRGKIHHNHYYGSTTRGRHFAYISAGGSYYDIHDNFIKDCPQAAIHIRATDAQSACVWNRVHNNQIHTTTSSNSQSGGIQVHGNVQDNIVENNSVDSAALHGIIVSNYSTSGSNLRTVVQGNRVRSASYHGIFIEGAKNAVVQNNYVDSCSSGASGTYSGISVDANGAVTADNTYVKGNIIPGTSQHRASIRFGPSTTGNFHGGNYVGMANAFAIEEVVRTQNINDVGVEYVYTSQTATTDSSEDNLMSTTILGGKLANNGDAIEFKVAGTTAANANNKTVKVYFGATAIFNSGAVPANDQDWVLEGTIVRYGASAAIAITSGHYGGSPVTPHYEDISSVTLTSDITFKVTGQGTSAGDITQQLMYVKYTHSPKADGT